MEILAEGRPARPQHPGAKRGAPRRRAYCASPFSPRTALAMGGKTVWLKTCHPGHLRGWSAGHRNLETRKPDSGVKSPKGRWPRPPRGDWPSKAEVRLSQTRSNGGIPLKSPIWMLSLDGRVNNDWWDECLSREGGNQRKLSPTKHLSWLVAYKLHSMQDWRKKKCVPLKSNLNNRTWKF